MRQLVLMTVLSAALVGCGTSTLPLAYTASASVTPAGRPIVGQVTATDARGETAEDANWYGAIRGLYGNPLKRLEADRPIADVSADAVRAGLRARGLLTADGAGPIDARVTVEQFESDQVARREAKVRLRLDWIARGTGRVVASSVGQSDRVNGSLITVEKGIFGSTADLQALAAQALSEAVDKALDDPAMRRVILAGS